MTPEASPRLCCQPLSIPDGSSPYCTGAWVAQMNWDLAEYHARAGSITQAQWDAYRIAWCHMTHDPMACNDLLGRIRSMAKTFHYRKPDGSHAVTQWLDGEGSESVLTRLYGPAVATKSRATWSITFPGPP